MKELFIKNNFVINRVKNNYSLTMSEISSIQVKSAALCTAASNSGRFTNKYYIRTHIPLLHDNVVTKIAEYSKIINCGMPDKCNIEISMVFVDSSNEKTLMISIKTTHLLREEFGRNGVIAEITAFGERFKVNQSMWDHANLLLDNLLGELNMLHATCNSKPTIVLCGHCVGGALATILTLRMLFEDNIKDFFNIKCVTFGSPLIASSELANLVNKKELSNNFLNYVYECDIIPQLKLLPEEDVMSWRKFLAEKTTTEDNHAISHNGCCSGSDYFTNAVKLARKCCNNDENVTASPIPLYPLGSYAFLEHRTGYQYPPRIFTSPKEIIERFPKALPTDQCIHDHDLFGGYLSALGLCAPDKDALGKDSDNNLLQSSPSTEIFRSVSSMDTDADKISTIERRVSYSSSSRTMSWQDHTSAASPSSSVGEPKNLSKVMTTDVLGNPGSSETSKLKVIESSDAAKVQTQESSQVAKLQARESSDAAKVQTQESSEVAKVQMQESSEGAKEQQFVALEHIHDPGEKHMHAPAIKVIGIVIFIGLFTYFATTTYLSSSSSYLFKWLNTGKSYI